MKPKTFANPGEAVRAASEYGGTMPWQERTELLLGADGLARLSASHVLVAGAGGVGACACEMLVRAGVGRVTVVDSDKVSESNINRQLPALHSTVGRAKVEVLKERMLDINPSLDYAALDVYLTEDTIPEVLGGRDFDYVVDAIDTLAPKVALIRWCLTCGLPLVSSMGAGAKTDVTRVHLDDISRTYMCPLAHSLRKRLHRLGISEGFLAVFSDEKPAEGAMIPEEGLNKRSNVGTVSYLPAVFGCACAQAVLSALAGKAEKD